MASRLRPHCPTISCGSRQESRALALPIAHRKEKTGTAQQTCVKCLRAGLASGNGARDHSTHAPSALDFTLACEPEVVQEIIAPPLIRPSTSVVHSSREIIAPRSLSRLHSGWPSPDVRMLKVCEIGSATPGSHGVCFVQIAHPFQKRSPPTCRQVEWSGVSQSSDPPVAVHTLQARVSRGIARLPFGMLLREVRPTAKRGKPQKTNRGPRTSKKRPKPTSSP